MHALYLIVDREELTILDRTENAREAERLALELEGFVLEVGDPRELEDD